MTAPWHALLKPLALGVGLTLALLALVWNGAPPAARASGPCTVCPAGGGCTYTTIQAAVDDADCAEIKVAQGVYSGVQGRPVPAGYFNPPASGLITQVVYISRTVTVRGGYTTTNWTTPDFIGQPTTLDAGGLGRVLVIAGNFSPTIEGLGLTNGRAAGLGGGPTDGGGGGYVLSATATLSACRVFGNAAGNGGGLVLWGSPATLSANRVTSNTAASNGGGVYLYNSPATLSANHVASNTAASLGGGLNLWDSDATLISNRVASNTASSGGGLFLFSSVATLSANSVISNTASSGGGGLYLDVDSDAILTNTVVADNRAGAIGSGLYIAGSRPRLLHTTIARNIGGGSSGLYVGLRTGNYSTVWLTNTILVSQATGISVTEGSTAALDSTLWYSNSINWGGAGAIVRSDDITGSPAFVDASSGGDYHIGPASAAIDRGVDAGVTTDKDGRLRDARPDLGAYEAAVLTGPTCTVCLDGSCYYTAIQPAVDAAACTEIKVA